VRFSQFTLSFFLFSCSYSFALTEEQTSINTVRISSDVWCPYSCLATDINQGLLVDVVRAAFKEHGINSEYKTTINWTRAIQNVKNGQNDVMLGVDVEYASDLDFVDEFIIPDETIFAVLKDDHIVLNNAKELMDYHIGIVSEYVYDESLGPWEYSISNHTNKTAISQSNGEAHLLTLLSRKRIKVAVMNLNVARYSLQINEQLPKIEFIRKGIISNLHIGFTRSERGYKLKTKFITGFKRLLDNGRLKGIYGKYNLEMPNFILE